MTDKILKTVGYYKELYLGKNVKKLKKYKQEVVDDIRNCMACGCELQSDREYGEVGHISYDNGYRYRFVKLCTDCFKKMKLAIAEVMNEEPLTILKELKERVKDQQTLWLYLEERSGK